MTNELEKQFTSVCSTESHVQQYECAALLFDKFKSVNIAVDGCLLNEIKNLHDLGIETIGSCCGHHANSPLGSAYIQVKTECEQKMIDSINGDELKQLRSLLSKIIDSLNGGECDV
jgi:hypothetical protein